MQNQPANMRAAERATEQRPAYLYQFTHGGSSYYLTSYDRDIVTTGSVAQTWTAAPVAHELNEGNAELSSRQATVAIGVTDEQFRRYFLTAPTTKATVKIYRVNSSLLPGPFDFAANCFAEFTGMALGPSFSDAAIAITFGSELAQEDRTILRFNYQPQCNHVIYGNGCFVDRELHKLTKTLAAANRPNRYVEVTGTTVPAPGGGTMAATAQSFEGGYLQETATGNLVGIVASALITGGIRLYLQWWPTTLQAGSAVTLYKGCRHTKAGCDEDFDNLDGPEGAITGLTQTGAHVVGAVPANWIRFANRRDRCVPSYNGSNLTLSQWKINEAVDFGGPEPVNLGVGIIVFLSRTLNPGDTAKLPRIGGFGGHPYIPIANPAVDGLP
jgi:hypothetical protein